MERVDETGRGVADKMVKVDDEFFFGRREDVVLSKERPNANHLFGSQARCKSGASTAKSASSAF